MKYQPHVQHLETEGFGETRHYAIAATGKAFRNLMDGLYSRKIEAVVRELSTNALDSHIDADKPGMQFRVQMPNSLRPQFTVRDYGVGMSHQLVMELYSTLFESTKDQSNKGNGMLGLGSKSPFAYTDGFTLRCYDGETRRTYASYLDNGGVPMISVADVSPCTEPRGVEVSFPVKREDCEAFEQAAARVYLGFASPPLGLSQAVRQQLEVEPDKTGAGWAFSKQTPLPKADAWALQGCVFYPVELNQIGVEKELVTSLRNMSGQLYLDFEMGSLEFTPGRETLSYTPDTKAALLARWNQFRNDMTEYFTEQFKDCATGWETALRAHEQGLMGMYSGFFRFTPQYDVVSKIDIAMGGLLPRTSNQSGYSETKFPFTVVNNEGSTCRFTKRARTGYPTKAFSGHSPVLWVERTRGVAAPNQRVVHKLQQLGWKYAVMYDQPHPGLPAPDLTKYGSPPVLRTEELPRPPAKPKPPSERQQWERFMITNTDGKGWQRVTESEVNLRRRAEYLFVNGYDDIIQPMPDVPARQWPVKGKVYDLRKKLLLRPRGSPPVILVRMRANEVYRRWSQLRLMADLPEDVVSLLPRTEVVALINLRNLERFNSSLYYSALNKANQHLREEIYERRRKEAGYALLPSCTPPSNPLLELDRFDTRVKRLRKREPFEAKLVALDDNMHEQLSARGVAMGLEVLPPLASNSRFPYPLLPLRWENMARMLAGRYGNPYSLGLLIRQLSAGDGNGLGS